jgi:hypothetical protein
MSGRRGYVVTSLRGAADPLTAPTPPTQGPPEAQGTASVSLTWTHPDAPASGITYALTATDTATGDPVTPSSGSGLGPWVLPVTDGQGIICTLTVTRTADSQAVPSLPYYVAVEQDVADAYPVEGSAGWRTVKEWNLKLQGTQGPIPNGAGTITLDGESITTRGATAGSGTFGTNNVAGLNASDGLYLECTTTASMLPELTLTLPLGETLGAEHALRVSMKVKIFNEDSNDSAALYIADPAVTPTFDVSASSDVGGLRITGQTASLTYRRGAAASSGVTVPAGWSNGTLLYVECIVPGYGNDMIVKIDDSGFLNATPDQRGRTQSGPASPTTTATAWADGLSSLKVMLGVYNGGAGAGTPKAAIENIKIEVR